jgi:hypothetical protein
VKEVLKEEGLDTEVIEGEISDQLLTEAVGFLGSPSKRVDGLDVELSARFSRPYGMICRMYLDGGQRVGIPSRDLIRHAMREAVARRGHGHACGPTAHTGFGQVVPRSQQLSQ